MSISEAPSSVHVCAAREILAASVSVARVLQATLSCPPRLILHRSQWRCLASSYYAVTQALVALLESACSLLGPLAQESMCCKLTGPLHALHQAVQEGETVCMQDTLPTSSNSRHSWLLERALKLGMSTHVVDIHLHHLLWTSSVVREQILRSAPIEGMELVLAEQTRDLCDIWSHVDAQDDFLSARTLLDTVMGELEEGSDTHQLTRFILQKLSWAENSGRITDTDDLPPFLWVNPEDLTRNPEALGCGAYAGVHEIVWLRGRFAVKDFFYIADSAAFGREAIIQGRLCHPNVIPLICSTKNLSKYNCSLVMELMEHDLRFLMMQRLEAGMEAPFPLMLAVDLMLQIAQGMEYLHSDDLRIIHRDLKSSNILVSFRDRAGVREDGVISHVHLKIADFGLSKAKYASARYTTKPIGTTAWMAPEVCEEGEEANHPNARYTNKADVYSFGMVCYEILTGKLPFEGTRIRRRVLSGERPRLPTHCPLALSSYIKRCWDQNPDQRPTFTEICRMLRYLKACIVLGTHDHESNAASEFDDFLLHALCARRCACIDDMLRSFEQQLDGAMRPRLLVIPFEMYCCSIVLQQFRDHIELADPQVSRDIYDQGSSLTISEDERKSMELEESRQPSKGHFRGAFKRVRDLFYMRGTHFSYKELRLATGEFSSLIVEDRLARVYSGQLVDGRRIAVRVLHEGKHEDLTKIKIASQLHHQNLVPLYGWCVEQGRVLLVYEYMPCGNLERHIFSRDEKVLGWQQRYKAVEQVAMGLEYLHQDMRIVHRNVNTSNILLDSNWNACLAVYGLAGGDSTSESIVGTMAYLAPEYLQRSGKVSHASDIFSFGVTVLEIATGRKAMPGGHEPPVQNWVWEMYQEGKVLRAADVRLAGNFDESEMRRLRTLGLVCTNADPQARPRIQEVLSILRTASDPPPPQARIFELSSRPQSPVSAGSSEETILFCPKKLLLEI